MTSITSYRLSLEFDYDLFLSSLCSLLDFHVSVWEAYSEIQIVLMEFGVLATGRATNTLVARTCSTI